MKRKTIVLFLFFIVVIFAFSFVFFNLSLIRSELEREIINYGLPALFIINFLIELFEQPFGPEIPSFFALALNMDFFLVFIFVSLGNFFGSLVSFFVGRKFLSDKIRASCSVKSHGKYCRFFSKHGRISLLVAAISPIPYVFFVWMSGAFGMKLRDFFYFGAIPRTIRILVVLVFIKFVIL
jgi:membrane protein YqaA with SNARE-associated domain